ncbi:MAG: hypothetical protein RL885_14035 [Planctomycetota bacterium]
MSSKGVKMNPLLRDRVSLVLVLLWLVPAIAIPCLAFSTEISEEELHARIDREYPGVFAPAIRDGSPAADFVNEMVNAQNWEMLAADERDFYRDEVWMYRRIPLAAVLWLAGFIAIAFLRRDQIRAATGRSAHADSGTSSLQADCG